MFLCCYEGPPAAELECHLSKIFKITSQSISLHYTFEEDRFLISEASYVVSNSHPNPITFCLPGDRIQF